MGRYAEMLRDRTKFLVFYEAMSVKIIFFLLNVQRILKFFTRLTLKKNLETLGNLD